MRWGKPQMPAKPRPTRYFGQKNHCRCIQSERCLFLQECRFSGHDHIEPCWHRVCTSTTTSKNISFASDPSKWPKTPSTSTPEAVWCDRRLQQHQTTGWPTAEVGHPHVRSPPNRNRRHPGSCRSWTCYTGSWQIERSTETGQRRESESIINSTMANRWSCSSAETSSSTSATEGWKRPRERWKILFTPWWRLESSRILWMGIQTISRFDLCIGPDWTWQCGTAIIAHDLPLLQCKWYLRGIWAG